MMGWILSPMGLFTLTSRSAYLAPHLFTEWYRESAGSGTKGERWFDWALILLAPSGVAGWNHWFLVRRHIQDKTEWSYYLVFAPSETTFSTMGEARGEAL